MFEGTFSLDAARMIFLSVTIDCLVSGYIEVQVTDASTTGKVALYNSVPVFCSEILTPTTTITVTFTTCDNPSD